MYVILFEVSVFKFCPYIKALKLGQNVEIFKTTDLRWSAPVQLAPPVTTNINRV